jgi:hypothetical protein
MPRSCRAVLTALLFVPLGARAQQVQGTVREGSGHPIAGAIVELSDGGRTVARALAGERGRFRITAPRPGAYRLRVLRIGYRAAVSDLITVPSSGILQHDVLASSAAIRLNDVVIRADRRCVVRPDEGAQAASLWEEARKALHATEIVAGAGYWARTRQFERQLDRRSGDTTFVRVWIEDRTIRGSPFAALPAEVLAERGYIHQEEADTLAYYAPDAHVLVADAFLDTHCFGVQESERGDGLIGLRFEPVANLEHPDVRGTLWIDPSSSELRWLEYWYTRLPRAVPRDAATGRVEFTRLPSGAWIVQAWRIRMPVYTITSRQREPVPFGPRRDFQQRTVTAIRERGGEVVTIEPGRPR